MRLRPLPTARSARLRVELLEDRSTPSAAAPTAYLATDLVSDQPGVAPVTDPTLVNAWGISLSPNGGAFWVSAAFPLCSTPIRRTERPRSSIACMSLRT